MADCDWPIIGVIGAASMQLTALRTTQQSGYQTVAVELASELANSIRMRPVATQAATENLYLKIDYSSRDGEPIKPAKLCYGVTADCTHEELTRFDIYEIEKRLKIVLPQGRIRVCKDAFPWDPSAHAYKWECSEAGAAATPIVIKLGWKPRNPEDGDIGPNSVPRPNVVLMVMSASA